MIELLPGWVLVELPDAIRTVGAPGHGNATFSASARVVAVGDGCPAELVGQVVMFRRLGAEVPLADRKGWAVPLVDVIGVFPGGVV